MFAIEIKINKVLIRLIILEFSITDEGFLSEGVMSEKSLCLEGVMYGRGFVRVGFVRAPLHPHPADVGRGASHRRLAKGQRMGDQLVTKWRACRLHVLVDLVTLVLRPVGTVHRRRHPANCMTDVQQPFSSSPLARPPMTSSSLSCPRWRCTGRSSSASSDCPSH